MRIFITGSTDGLGKMAAIELKKQGHDVVLHARSFERKEDIQKELSWAQNVLVADLSKNEEVKNLAGEINKSGPFDSIIHNAGVYRSDRNAIFHVNVLAPYILTSLIDKPKRLIYLNSGMHEGGRIDLAKMDKGISYSDSKLLLLLFANAVARKWPDVLVNSVNPGWVPTKMGGRSAPDDLIKGMQTQVWLATSEDKDAKVAGKYFFHKNSESYREEADDHLLQDEFIEICTKLTGIELS